MKRLSVRLTALAVVVLLGVYAIAQAQRGSAGASEPDPVDVPSVAEATPQPRANPEPTPAADPFAGRYEPIARSPQPASAPAVSRFDDEQDDAAGPPRGFADDHYVSPAGDPFGLRNDEVQPTRYEEEADEPTPADEIRPNPIRPSRVANDDDRYAEPAAEPRRFTPEPTPQRGQLLEPQIAPATEPDQDDPDEYTPRPTQAAPPRRLAPSAEPSVEPIGRPGGKQLEGAQSPSVTIEKIAPAEIQIGKPATFEVRVRNSGQIAARGVEVVDQVPVGTRLISTVPRASADETGGLVWQLDTLEPGESTSVKMEVMPTDEGTIGSVASVRFRTEASASTIATRPLLSLEMTGPDRVLVGDEVRLSITISNPGSGRTTNIILEEDVPPGLVHDAGKELEFEVGDLEPGESRQIELILTAAKPGRVVNELRARADASLQASGAVDLVVIAPGLEVALTGPKRRYLQRNATYTVSVSNPGTAAAHDVELVTYLPKGMKFVDANNAGTYDPNEHAVFWSLEELPANVTGDVTLVAIPVEPGEQLLRVEGRTAAGLAHERQETVLVEGVAAVSFQVVDLADPIEVGGEGSYEIRVTNGGSKSATGVRVAVLLPPEMKAISAKGPTSFSIDGSTIRFEPLTRLAPEDEQIYRVRTQALQPGDLRVKVQLQSDEMTRPVTKEESTRVFSDQ